ncbi:hypothetical protein [Novosphingobium sp. KA1]|uniref:hypothetical protein n=1 Tax=Novosphingobium sp. (strain KA1) TaxID=164608 RepID=UPI001A8DDD43|nr:hypothetical protein [Novosphingobium sp. KA1]QSR16048.1 hypothetical protein CA833_02355 [Novosphingobium sp. KA1]
MAIAASTIHVVSANAQSWLQRVVAQFIHTHDEPVPATITTTIVDLRLILRRIEHARREHMRWDSRYLSQTVRRAVIAPLEELNVSDNLHRLRHGAIFALAPIAEIGRAHAREAINVDRELEEAAHLVRAAIADAEASRD